MKQEWFTCAELAALRLPGVPATTRGVALMAQKQHWAGGSWARPREGRGGGLEYGINVLPPQAQAALCLRRAEQDLTEQAAAGAARQGALWDRYARATDQQRAKAGKRLQALEAVRDQERRGATRSEAIAVVAREIKVSTSTLWNWMRLAAFADRGDRQAILLPAYVGRTATAACDPRAWHFLTADYLRPERPAMKACYRRLLEAAAAQGWSPVPSLKTLERRIKRELPRGARVLAREGSEAARALYPAQIRDRSVFEALEAVNADGHKFDVFVRWDDGSVVRPVMLAIQDLYSGRILAHRIDRSENRELVRLAFADLVDSFGVPRDVYLDNGRAFASKWISGGMQTRFRFKVKEEEPAGLLNSLGCTVHWTQPYSGQSKPIERAFRDLCEEVARHPFCAGAYTGNAVDAKPENYASRAVPIEAFRQHVAEQIARHNTRPGRRTAVCRGRSFAETFEESFRQAMVRTITPVQRHFLLLAAEGVTVSKRGEVLLAENHYYAQELAEFIGRKVVVRFDPQNLHDDVQVYSLAGEFIITAQCRHAVGFNDVEAARRHAQQRKAWLKAQREVVRLTQVLSVEELARLLPGGSERAPEAPRVVRPIFGQAVPKATVQPLSDHDYDEAMDAVGRALRARAGADVLPFDGSGDD